MNNNDSILEELFGYVEDNDDVEVNRILKSYDNIKEIINSRTEDGGTCLTHASRVQDIPVVKALLHYKADPNYSNIYGYTPIQMAVQGRDDDTIPTIKLLVDNGADFNIIDHDNDLNLIELASEPKVKEYLKKLLQK